MNLSRVKSTKRRQPRNVVYVYPFLCLLPLIPILKLLDPLPNLVTLSSFSSIAIIGNVHISGISLVQTIPRTCVTYISSFFRIIQNIKLTQNYLRLSSILCQNYEKIEKCSSLRIMVYLHVFCFEK